MHEMGIAATICETVEQELALRPQARLRRVGLRIGELSGVDVESLSFCLACAVKDTPLESAELAIERTADDALDIVDLELEMP